MYPDTKQRLSLNEWLRICRYWYNRQLGDRFDWWSMNRSSIYACPLVSSIAPVREKPNYYTQKKQLPIIKKDLVKVFHRATAMVVSRVDHDLSLKLASEL